MICSILAIRSLSRLFKASIVSAYVIDAGPSPPAVSPLPDASEEAPSVVGMLETD